MERKIFTREQYELVRRKKKKKVLCPICKEELKEEEGEGEEKNWVRKHPLCYFILEVFSEKCYRRGMTDREVEKSIVKEFGEKPNISF